MKAIRVLTSFNLLIAFVTPWSVSAQTPIGRNSAVTVQKLNNLKDSALVQIPQPLKQSFNPNLLEKAQGGMNSGGGNFVVLPGGEKVLLDLFLKDPSLAFMNRAQAGVKMPVTVAYSKLGFDRVAVSNPVLQRALARVAVWSENSPKLMSLLDQSLRNTAFLYMKYDLNFRDPNYALSEKDRALVAPEQLKTAAFYSENLGVLLSKTDFDSLNDVNQVATLIHEGLRHVQIGYGREFSNSVLQDLTAKIVMEAPSTTISLDETFERSLKLTQVLDQAHNSVCSLLELQSVPGYSCAGIKEISSVDQLKNILLDFMNKVVVYDPNRPTYGGMPVYTKLLAVAGAHENLNIFSMFSILDEAVPAVATIKDSTMKATLVGVTKALNEPNNPSVQRQVQQAFQQMLDAGAIKNP